MATNEPINWKEFPKKPFYVVGALPVFFGFFLAWNYPHAVSHGMLGIACVACVVTGSLVAILPFIFDYRATQKLIEINALGAVADKIEHLDQFSAQITAATGRWAAVQEFVGDKAEKTAAAAKQIADKLSAEGNEFVEKMKQINDRENSALRLESEKNRRSETEWVQTLIQILDHIFALHVAAARSNQPKVAEQISQFQNACRGMVRRVGLNAVVPEPNEPFSAERHQVIGGKKPTDGGPIAETIASGYTFQGKTLRPALVRLREPGTPAPASTPTPANPSPNPAPAPAPAPATAPAASAAPAKPVAPVAPIPAEKPKAPVAAQETLALKAD